MKFLSIWKKFDWCSDQARVSLYWSNSVSIAASDRIFALVKFHMTGTLAKIHA